MTGLLIEAYNNIIKSNLEQIEKSTLLVSTLVNEELIDNEFHKQHMLSICENNLIALNNSLIDNQILFSVLKDKSNEELLKDILISYIKNNSKLTSQLEETKLLFDSICKKKFNNELRSELAKRKENQY